MPVIPALGKRTQENYDFEASLGNIETMSQKEKQKTKNIVNVGTNDLKQIAQHNS
jgi:hypothetical protein